MKKQILADYLDEFKEEVDEAMGLYIEDYVDREDSRRVALLELENLKKTVVEFMEMVAKRMVKNA